MSNHQIFIDSVINKIADTGLKTMERVIEEIDNNSSNNNTDNQSNNSSTGYYDNDENNTTSNETFCRTYGCGEDIEENTLSDIFNINSENFKKKSSNRYLIQSNNYDVDLQNWELISDGNDYFVSGQLENKNWWNTSYIKHIDIRNDHLKIRTINNTIYRCFYTESLDFEFGRRIYL